MLFEVGNKNKITFFRTIFEIHYCLRNHIDCQHICQLEMRYKVYNNNKLKFTIFASVFKNCLGLLKF